MRLMPQGEEEVPLRLPESRRCWTCRTGPTADAAARGCCIVTAWLELSRCRCSAGG